MERDLALILCQSMASLDPAKLHAYLSDCARAGRTVTEKEVAEHFGVDIGGVKKRFGLLTGKIVLKEIRPGVYDCSNVPLISVTAFDSAGSQGKSNQEYVGALLQEIERLRKNNDVMRARLMTAHNRLRELGEDPTKLS